MSDLVISNRMTIPADAITISHSRSSGPGGQNVNKVNSRVTLRWTPDLSDGFHIAWRERFVKKYGNRINADGQFVLHSERYRDQRKNIQDVRQRLMTMLRECQFPPKARKPTKPSRGSKERRLKSKKQNSQKKQLRRSGIPRD